MGANLLVPSRFPTVLGSNSFAESGQCCIVYLTLEDLIRLAAFASAGELCYMRLAFLLGISMSKSVHTCIWDNDLAGVVTGWKAAWEDNELSLNPYSASMATSALMELKSLVQLIEQC